MVKLDAVINFDYFQEIQRSIRDDSDVCALMRTLKKKQNIDTCLINQPRVSTFTGNRREFK